MQTTANGFRPGHAYMSCSDDGQVFQVLHDDGELALPETEALLATHTATHPPADPGPADPVAAPEGDPAADQVAG